MILGDIVEEILEKVGNGPGRDVSMRSIVRKVDTKHKEIHRLYGNNSDDMAVLDILEGIAEYPLPCAQGNITSVYVNDVRIPFRARNDYTMVTYYYLIDQSIGLYLYGNLLPSQAWEQGLKIFHKHVPATLTVNDLNAEPDLEETYHMLLVYGVLIDIAEPSIAGKYEKAYRELLADYIQATRDPESNAISEVFSL
ncbi:phage adaptor protein [Paenibacillus koleovorans]|uniref:phage adaptor protein n=1 Tax=Paenibacillus koleovorans TaxID=121608 RepID=UPI000FDA82C0|nr:hypothetical protein [Paenibacillus koleovorans]